MKEVLYIPYPETAAGKKVWAQEYGMNAYYGGKHWSKRRRDADYWHALTRIAIDQYSTRTRPFLKGVIIRFYWNDKLDLDNHSVMGKMIVDGLKNRIITDDARKYIRSIQHFWHDENYIKIEIEEANSKD